MGGTALSVRWKYDAFRLASLSSPIRNSASSSLNTAMLIMASIWVRSTFPFHRLMVTSCG